MLKLFLGIAFVMVIIFFFSKIKKEFLLLGIVTYLKICATCYIFFVVFSLKKCSANIILNYVNSPCRMEFG